MDSSLVLSSPPFLLRFFLFLSSSEESDAFFCRGTYCSSESVLGGPDFALADFLLGLFAFASCSLSELIFFLSLCSGAPLCTGLYSPESELASFFCLPFADCAGGLRFLFPAFLSGVESSLGSFFRGLF